MAELGFWNVARENPDHIAIVTPDEQEIRAGDLLASCNQLVHGLRDLGLKPGDVIATVFNNEAAVLEVYMAAAQAGWYVVPINHHLVAPEIAYILQNRWTNSCT